MRTLWIKTLKALSKEGERERREEREREREVVAGWGGEVEKRGRYIDIIYKGKKISMLLEFSATILGSGKEGIQHRVER